MNMKSELFNFLDPKLSPKVTCKSPSMDNYEPDNLIHPNFVTRARGYLAYTVIKPPVEIEFEFLCSVNIAFIDLNTTIGNQKCTGIELFAKSNSSSTYVSIGKSVYDKDGIVFCNSRRYNKNNPPPGYNEHKTLCFFKSDSFRSFLSASALKVVIFRTNRTVPCLGSVQIFGTVARNCSQITKDTVNKIMGVITTTTHKENRPLEEKASDLQVPKDFMDDLTCEIMAVPMTLPSGKTIDRETLEKHTKSEASFGRKPGDPFTGLKFTDCRKPILNVPLKSRIDMFLLQNSANPVINGIKRTTGASYGSKNKRFKSSNEILKCCKTNCGEIALYVIPNCEHFYCKECLLNLSSGSDLINCLKCGQKFNKNQAERFHQQL